MMKVQRFLLTFLLVVGFAAQINDHQIIVKYKKGAVTKTSKVSRDMSVCLPKVGQKVFFYKNYKIVECVESM